MNQMKKNDWNPEMYLKHGKERILPSIDLVSRIDYNDPASIIDIGCGPGNSTQILHNRWPESRIIGLDVSEAMIRKARKDFPDQEWIIMDAGTQDVPGEYDIVFSNATIQWIPDHPGLFKRFRNILRENGILAIQLPLFWNMPLGKSIADISRDPGWSEKTNKVNDQFTIHGPGEYYDMLSSIFRTVEIWRTDYYHIMDSHTSILEMISSTGLRPFLDALEDDSEKDSFRGMVLERIQQDYPEQKNRKVLFPFYRLFLIAQK